MKQDCDLCVSMRLLDLPECVLHREILPRLSGKTIISLAGTNKYFHKLCLREFAWTSVNVKVQNYEDVLAFFNFICYSNVEGLRKINMDFKVRRYYGGLLAIPRNNVKCLSLNVQSVSDDIDLRGILSNLSLYFPSVNDFTLNVTGYLNNREIPKSFWNLQKLSLHIGGNNFDNNLFVGLLGGTNRLEHFSYYAADFDCVEEFLDQCGKTLLSLDVRDCGFRWTDYLEHNCPQLQHLAVEEFGFFTRPSSYMLPKHLTSLKVSAPAFDNNYRRLRCEQITSFDFQCLPMFTVFADQSKRNIFEDISQMFPNLVCLRVEFRNAKPVSDASVQKHLQRLPYLQRLEIRNATCLCGSFLLSVEKENFPALRCVIFKDCKDLLPYTLTRVEHMPRKLDSFLLASSLTRSLRCTVKLINGRKELSYVKY